MNIVKNINQYNENNIFFCEPIKNNIMNDGNFIRILYSTHNILLNGIYLLISLNNDLEPILLHTKKCFVEKTFQLVQWQFKMTICGKMIWRIFHHGSSPLLRWKSQLFHEPCPQKIFWISAVFRIRSSTDPY